MTFKEKIDNLLRISGKKFNSVYDLEVQSGVGMGTIRKAYDENREPSKRTIWKFLESLSINPEWWESGNGSIYLEKPTLDVKPDDNNGKPETEHVWERIEKSEKYTVVPTIILDKYEILSNREIESREVTLQEVRAAMKIAIDAKDQVITMLQKEIFELNEKLKPTTPPQQTQ